jgi:uncharacterized membrane protein
MLREARLRLENEKDAHGFRIRGREVTRLEAFSDAVFAFALTLLVVSLEVPKTFADLVETMRGFVAFGVCFAILAMIWNHHYVYSRRFGLQDGFVRFLTCLMLFIVLLYVYPLKFLFNLFVNGMILGGKGGGLTHAEASTLFVIYGLGFAAIYLAFAALYLHAWWRRAELELNDFEMLDTRWEIYAMLCHASVGIASALVALSIIQVGLAGFVYFSLFIIMWIHGTLHGRKRRAMAAALTPRT